MPLATFCMPNLTNAKASVEKIVVRFSQMLLLVFCCIDLSLGGDTKLLTKFVRMIGTNSTYSRVSLISRTVDGVETVEASSFTQPSSSFGSESAFSVLKSSVSRLILVDGKTNTTFDVLPERHLLTIIVDGSGMQQHTMIDHGVARLIRGSRFTFLNLVSNETFRIYRRVYSNDTVPATVSNELARFQTVEDEAPSYIGQYTLQSIETGRFSFFFSFFLLLHVWDVV